MTDAYTLTVALGGTWSGGKGMASCPAHADRTPSLSLSDSADGRLLLHCHAGCDFRAVLDALRGRGLIAGRGSFKPIGEICRAERRKAERAFKEKRARQARRVWQEARPITGTLAETYLKARAITCPLPESLRYLGNCWHQTGQRYPALISYVRNAGKAPGFAVHRTYLRADGLGKASVTPAKAMLGPVSGGAVRLSEGPGPLIVTEGIETGLSLLSGLLDQPGQVWAALSAGGMARLHLPDRPGRLIVAPDGDAVGQEAAEKLAIRAHALGWRVSFLPAPEGFDWNDVLTGKAVLA
jgi:hypothetical protein